MKKLTPKQIKEFDELADPMIKYLNDNFHPHVTVVITTVDAELSEGQRRYTTLEHVKD